VEVHGILYPNCLKKWGGRAPRVPHLIAPMDEVIWPHSHYLFIEYLTGLV